MADFTERLEKELVRAVQGMGESIFRDSQRNVPVVTGQLKRSGYIRRLPNGIEIGYSAPYAAKIEYGYIEPRRSRVRLARPQDVSSSSIFLLRPVRSRSAPVKGLKPRHYLTNAVDRALSRWGVTVGSHLQRTLGR